MTIRVLAASSPGEVRVAAVDESVLLDFFLWRPGAPDGVGDLHRARITAKLPALAASFCALGGGLDGFLPDSEGGAALGEGDFFFARVSRAAQGGKGPRVTARLSEAETAGFAPGSPALLRRGSHGVLRMAAAYPNAAVVSDDPALVALLRPVLHDRISVRPRGLLNEAVAAQIADLALPELELPRGMRMTITPTRALVAIDIDTGSASASPEDKRRHQLRANRDVLPLLARQIRLRNLSGAILVDFAGVPSRARPALGPALAGELSPDPLRPRLLGFTALGLAEILRPRVHPPLHEMLAGPHAAGLAALRHLAAEIAARPSRKPALRAAPAVATALRGDQVALEAFAHRCGRKLRLRDDHALAPLGWRTEEDV